MATRKTTGKKKKARTPALTARTADRHALYQTAVQGPEADLALVERTFKRRARRAPRSLREDFCGTALLCSHWVMSHPERTATGVDIDPAVLAWGRTHNVEPLGDASERVALVEGDVRDVRTGRHDIVCAFNYSYWYFKERAEMRRYFEAVREALEPGGIFILDHFGGWEAVQVLEEERRYRGFRYVWDQAAFNPITHDFKAHIHFRFPDGTKIEPAFTYDWRMWTLPELRDLLEEAGYVKIECLWEDEDATGQGSGVFRPRKHVENDPAFNAYLVAGVPEE